MKYIKKVIIVFLVIVLIFFILFGIKFIYTNNTYKLSIFNENEKHDNNINLLNSKEIKKELGYLTIQKASLEDEIIKEGTQDDILKNNIGHFSNTSRFNGNVCIAAHNYSIKDSNLFKDLNKLNIGDKIIYKTEYGTRQYKVDSIKEIKSNDFSVLENTKENVLTLITCIGLRKDIRLCVKASEIKEE